MNFRLEVKFFSNNWHFSSKILIHFVLFIKFSNIGNAFWSTPWYNMSRQYVFCGIMFVVVSHIPFKVKALIFEMTISCFGDVSTIFIVNFTSLKFQLAIVTKLSTFYIPQFLGFLLYANFFIVFKMQFNLFQILRSALCYLNFLRATMWDCLMYMSIL